jgi:hypothetical protein
MPQMVGSEALTGSFELDPSGAVMLLSRGTGLAWSVYLQDEVCSWWQAGNPLQVQSTVINSGAGRIKSVDCESEFGSFGRIWNMWGVKNDLIGGIIDIRGIGIGPPYDAGAHASTYGPWALDDNVGSVDGMVSDLEYTRLAVDAVPQGITPWDRIFYYLESAPDDNDIEIWNNISTSLGAGKVYVGNIQETAHVGTAVDVCVLNVFGAGTGQDPDATGNWLLVLEDNGDNTWQIAIYEQDGTFVSRSETQDGDPWGMDVDHQNRIVHVWFDDAGTASYTTMQWVNCP